nr:MAG TPA: hypothetical protein [Caudoviricetes sp.]
MIPLSDLVYLSLYTKPENQGVFVRIRPLWRRLHRPRPLWRR